MTLLNSAAMFAAAAVIIPILIHLQKRRKSKVVDWPAMQFLQRTVTSRRRGLTLENLLLLLVRCLLVLLFVFAMARPAIETGRYFSWLIFFLLAGCGLLLLTAAIVSGWQRRHRLIGVVAAVLLFGVAGVLLSTSPESLVDSEVDREVALVIDSSLTMTLSSDNTSPFYAAIAQARTLVESLSGNSTVSIVLAGPITEVVEGSPFRNLRKAEQVLGTLAPVAGGSDLKSAIEQANSLLKRAPNTRKQVLLLTDDQLCAWESLDEIRLAERSIDTEVKDINDRERNSEPEIARAAIVARLPTKSENLSIDRLLVDASLVTAHRPVPIDVELRNGGSTTVRDVAVKLLIDGRETATEALIQIEPGVSSTVRFLHAFPQAGQHIISATTENADQLVADNRIDSVVDVIPHLSILMVNGSTDADLTQQSATFAQLALDPTSLREPPVAGDIDDAEGGDADRAIMTTVIEATRLGEIESLESFQLVMLCDVPRLPVDAAERLARFVGDGGGLWVIPGEQADTSFYNNWRMPLTDEPVMPAQLGERTEWLGEAAADGRVARLGVALDVAGRPFISDLFERGGHDLADVSVTHFWKSTPIETSIVGMALTNGEALFAEQALGRGRVLMQSVSLARRDSTFPSTLGFPVFMHLWTFHLAASLTVDSNIEPTSEFFADLAARIGPTDRLGTLQLSEPTGTRREIPVSWKNDSPVARIGRVAVPGVYQLNHGGTGAPVASFAVHRDTEESDLSVVSEDRLNEISHDLGIELIDDVSQLAAPISAETVGVEIWDTLLFIALWLLAAECLVTMWIRSRRRVSPSATSESNDSHDRQSSVPPLATALKSPGRWENLRVDDSVTDSLSATGVSP